MRKRVGSAAVAIASLIVAVVGFASPAQAYTRDFLGYWNTKPDVYFYKNSSSPLNSTLSAYVSVNGAAYRIVMRAGSGNGSTNECLTNQGWLPDGQYSNTDADSGSRFKHYYKDWGSTVVRGWVWELGNKKCYNGTYRTALFIHSNGYSGWSDSNYRSEGCIKINQTDRSYLSSMYRSAYQSAYGTLWVS